MNVDLQYRTITPYWIPVFNVTADICGVLKGLKEHPIVEFYIELTKQLPKGILYECPYIDDLRLYNLTIPSDFKYIPQFAYGEYKLKSHFFDTVDDNIFTALFVFETKFYNSLDGKRKKPKSN